MNMVIENRNLEAGTVLAARYKGKRYECTVLESDGVKAYSLEDNSIHKSPSAAASKVMDGASVNGWRFWSLASEVEEKPERAVAARTPKPATVVTKLVKVIKRVPNQKGVAEGSTKWWCSACMKAFVAEGTLIPPQCPESHPREQADEFAAVPKEEADTE